MIFKKIKKLAKKVFSSKTYLLAGVNRMIPDSMGKMTDILVDREDKNIYLQLTKDSQVSELNILKYEIKYEGTQAYLTFEKIEKTGYLASLLKNLGIDKKLKIEPKYIKIVQTMI